jgi:hypothetical protein
MTVHALGLLRGFCRRTLSAKDINFVCNKLQMKRINAPFVAAKMIGFALFRNLIPEYLIDDQIRESCFNAGYERSSVASGAQIASPYPATCIKGNGNFIS